MNIDSFDKPKKFIIIICCMAYWQEVYSHSFTSKILIVSLWYWTVINYANEVVLNSNQYAKNTVTEAAFGITCLSLIQWLLLHKRTSNCRSEHQREIHNFLIIEWYLIFLSYFVPLPRSSQKASLTDCLRKKTEQL